MVRTFEKGNILSPFKENNFEIKYCERTKEEGKLRQILNSSFSNEYYSDKRGGWEREDTDIDTSYEGNGGHKGEGNTREPPSTCVVLRGNV